MGYRKWVEISCDGCGGADYAIGGSIASAKIYARDNGHFLKGSKIYCTKKCMEASQAVHQAKELK